MPPRSSQAALTNGQNIFAEYHDVTVHLTSDLQTMKCHNFIISFNQTFYVKSKIKS